MFSIFLTLVSVRDLKAYTSAADPCSFIAVLVVMKEEASAAQLSTLPGQYSRSINLTVAGTPNSVYC
jgi:hypothetical protein